MVKTLKTVKQRRKIRRKRRRRNIDTSESNHLPLKPWTSPSMVQTLASRSLKKTPHCIEKKTLVLLLNFIEIIERRKGSFITHN